MSITNRFTGFKKWPGSWFLVFEHDDYENFVVIDVYFAQPYNIKFAISKLRDGFNNAEWTKTLSEKKNWATKIGITTIQVPTFGMKERTVSLIFDIMHEYQDEIEPGTSHEINVKGEYLTNNLAIHHNDEIAMVRNPLDDGYENFVNVYFRINIDNRVMIDYINDNVDLEVPRQCNKYVLFDDASLNVSNGIYVFVGSGSERNQRIDNIIAAINMLPNVIPDLGEQTSNYNQRMIDQMEANILTVLMKPHNRELLKFELERTENMIGDNNE